MSYTGSIALNALQAPDQYTPLSTIEGVPIIRILLDVANQAIYWQLKIAVPGGSQGNWESAEKYMLPGSRQINRAGICGVRIRAAIPFSQLPAGSVRAIATVEAVTS